MNDDAVIEALLRLFMIVLTIAVTITAIGMLVDVVNGRASEVHREHMFYLPMMVVPVEVYECVWFPEYHCYESEVSAWLCPTPAPLP